MATVTILQDPPAVAIKSLTNRIRQATLPSDGKWVPTAEAIEAISNQLNALQQQLTNPITVEGITQAQGGVTIDGTPVLY